MNPVTPFLRPSSAKLPTAAGWLPNPAPATWLAEAAHITRQDLHATVHIFPVASSRAHRSPAGALLTLSGNQLPPDQLFRPHTLPLGEPFPGVFIPTSTTISPSLTPEEISRCFPYPIQFLHPSIGLCGFHPADAIDPVGLLCPPQLRTNPWNLAVPAPPDPPTLQGLSLTLPTQAGFPHGDPGHDGPPTPGRTGIAEIIFRGIASHLGSLGADALRSIGSSTKAQRLDSWSHQFRRDLTHLRASEINRLLNDLESDPRKGIRRAIPLARRNSPHRGPTTPPSAKLANRPSSWNPNDPPDRHSTSDSWNLTRDQFAALEAAYRYAASLEVSAGQWSRAARIYGELLGDWRQCAAMLERAALWQDAAIIHRDRCHNHQRAALCFENAGCFDDAMQSWLASGFTIAAADLLARAGRQTEADELYREACRQSGHDPVRSAAILEQKLHRPDEAISLLAARWRRHADTTAFAEYFAMLSRHGHHETALANLSELTTQPKSCPHPTTTFLSTLRTIFSTYPDPAVRAAAANLALHTAGRFLTTTQSRRSDAVSILSSLHHFAPDDPLLRDDANRFLALHHPAAYSAAAPSSPRQPTAVISLPDSGPMAATQWLALSCHSGKLSAAGLRPNPQATPTPVIWHSATRETEFPPVNLSGPAPHHLGFLSTSHISLLHTPSPNPSDCGQAMWYQHDRSGSDLTRPDVTQLNDVLAITRHHSSGGFIVLCRKPTGSLVAEHWHAQGQHLLSRMIPMQAEASGHPWLAASCHHTLWIAHGHSLWCFQEPDGRFREATHTLLPHPITCLTAPGTKEPSLAAATDSDGNLWLLTPRAASWGIEITPIPTHPVSLAAFTPNGFLHAASALGGLAFAPANFLSPVRQLAFPANTSPLIDTCPTGPESIAFLSRNGRIFAFD